jgi:hypothetical protein
MDKNVLNDSKYFEKQEIRWFSVEDMKRKKSKFRGFYREIIDMILGEMKNINSFVKKGSASRVSSSSKTRKRQVKGG